MALGSTVLTTLGPNALSARRYGSFAKNVGPTSTWPTYITPFGWR